MKIEVPEVINQKVCLPFKNGIELYIKREDLIHPKVSGNKYRKLKYNLQFAKEKGYSKILTFGGAYSNHIAATAMAGKLNKVKTIGVIRGDELSLKVLENPTLRFAHECGMEFYFLDRESYRKKNTLEIQEILQEKFGNFYCVPEGGTNELAVKGCQEILKSSDAYFDVITTAVGTGGTISGLINSSEKHQKVIGFPALAGDFLSKEIKKITNKENWQLISEYNKGGYAKIDSDLIDFLNDFYQKTAIPLDPIYTGKMIYGVVKLIENHFFEEKTKILAIHTGGLQGIYGVNQKLEKQNKNKIIYENEIG